MESEAEKKENVHWEPEPPVFCFLTAAAMWPAAASSSCHAFPVRINCSLQQWAETTFPSSYYCLVLFVLLWFCCQVYWLIKNQVPNIPSEASNTLLFSHYQRPNSKVTFWSGAWWCIWDSEMQMSWFKASVIYKGSFRTSRAAQRNLVLWGAGLCSKKPSLLLPLPSLTDSSEQVESDPLVFIASKLS